MVRNKVSLLSAWSQTEMLMQMPPPPSVWYNDSPTNSTYEETERRSYINKNSPHLSENDFLLPSGNLRHTFTLPLQVSSISPLLLMCVCVCVCIHFFYHLITHKVEISARRNIAVKKKNGAGFLERLGPRPGMSISFPTASQNQGVFSAQNEMCVYWL